jgi:methyl-accepting chemotaxis protein
MFALTLTIVVVLILGGVLLAWRGYNSRRDDALVDFGNGAPAAAHAAEAFFEQHLAFLSSIAASPDVRAGDVSEIGPHLEDVAATGVGFDDLSLINVDGLVEVSTNPATPGTDVSDRSYVQSVLRNPEPFVSEGLIGRQTGEPVVVLSVPVDDEDGQLAAILTGTVHLDRATDIIPMDSGDRLQIVDSARMLIYDGEPLPEPGPPQDPTALDLPPGEA